MRAQRGTKGGTSAGVDARISSTVRARIKHVIDRGEGAQSVVPYRRREGRELGGRKMIVQTHGHNRAVVS